MDDWRPSRFGDLVKVTHGYAFSSSEFYEELTDAPIVVAIGNYSYEGGFRFDSTRVKEFRGEFPTNYLLEPGDVLVAMTCQTAGGEILGIPGTIPDDGRQYLHNQRLGKLIVNVPDEIDLRFAYYLMLAPCTKQYLFATASGSKILHTAPGRIENLRFLLPPLPEQRAIAEVLGALDDKIESNRRIVQTSEALVRAEYLRVTNGAALVPMVPWVQVQMGSAFKGAYFSEAPVGRPLIRIRDLKTYWPQVWTTEVRPDEIVIQPGDVVVGMDAEFRSTLWLGERGVLNQRMCRFVPGDGVARAFAFQAIQRDLAFFEGAKSGTTVIHLNKSDIDRFQVPKLSIERHAELGKSTDPLVDRLIVASEENRALSQLRDTLLPALLSGRIRVPAAAELVEA